MHLPVGNRYVMSDGVAQNTLDLYGGRCLEIQTDFKTLKNRYSGQDLSNKSLISIREGGAGDLLFKTPVFRYLKNKYPSCKIGLSCSPIYHSLFKYNPDVNDLYTHILSFEEFSKYTYFSTFEGVIEQSREAEFTNAYDLYAQKYGINPSLLDKTPILTVPQITIDYWNHVLGELPSSKKIGFQWRASSPVRTLPFVLSASIIKRLCGSGYTVFILDAIYRKNDVAQFIQDNNLVSVIDTSKFSDNYERMAGIISLMDMFVGPDSSGTHIAAALGKPIVGLYGPFRSELRLKYYKNSVGIDCLLQKCGRGCFLHAYHLCNFAQELGERAAPCWKVLNVDTVVNEVNHLYDTVYADK